MIKSTNSKLTISNIISIGLLSAYVLSITLGPVLKINSNNNPFVLAEINGEIISKESYNTYAETCKKLAIEYCNTEENYVLFQLLNAEAKHRSIIVDEQEITEYINNLENNLATTINKESSISSQRNRVLLRAIVKDKILVDKVKVLLDFPTEIKPIGLKTRVQLANIIFDQSTEDIPPLNAEALQVLVKNHKVTKDKLFEVEYVDIPIVSKFTDKEVVQQALDFYKDNLSSKMFRTPERRSANLYKIPLDKSVAFESAINSGDAERILNFISYQTDRVVYETYTASKLLDIVFALGEEGEYHRTCDGTYAVLTKIHKGYIKPFDLVKWDAVMYLKQDELFYLEKNIAQKNSEYFTSDLDVKTAWVSSIKPNTLHPELHYQILTEKVYAGSFSMIPDTDNPARKNATQRVRVFRVKQIIEQDPSEEDIKAYIIDNYQIQVIRDRLESYTKNKVFEEDSEVLIDLNEENYLYPKGLLMNMLKNPQGIQYYHDKSAKILYVFKVIDLESTWSESDITEYVSTPPSKYNIIQKLWNLRAVSSNKFKPYELC